TRPRRPWRAAARPRRSSRQLSAGVDRAVEDHGGRRVVEALEAGAAEPRAREDDFLLEARAVEFDVAQIGVLEHAVIDGRAREVGAVEEHLAEARLAQD